MIDLTNHTIKALFEERVRELTRRTQTTPREDYFDYQFSGRWLE